MSTRQQCSHASIFVGRMLQTVGWQWCSVRIFIVGEVIQLEIRGNKAPYRLLILVQSHKFTPLCDNTSKFDRLSSPHPLFTSKPNTTT